MKKRRLAFLSILGGAMVSWAIVIPRFSDTTKFIERGKDIVIADCIAMATNPTVVVEGTPAVEELRDGLYPVEVNVIRSLKGVKPLGKQRIVTLYAMIPGRRYLLYSRPNNLGSGTDFFAVAELSVVEVSDRFDLSRLDGRPVQEQVSLLFAERLANLRATIPKLESEERLLEKAVHQR